MSVLTLFMALSLAQSAVPPPPAGCATALSVGTSTATAQICIAEQHFQAGQAIPPGTPGRGTRLLAAVEAYRRAFGLTPDVQLRSLILERLLTLFDAALLNDPPERDSVFRELIALKPDEVDPLFRYAAFQEAQGSVESAEDTLLSARRLHPTEIEPYRTLAQFYARRATALHSQQVKDKPTDDPKIAGAPDKNGVYRIGGDVIAPRRFGNAPYPPDAQAAGIQGAVVAEITVNEEGVVTDAQVLRSIPLLDEAALKAVREWRYDPTVINGKAVPVRMTVTVNFTLKQ